jgi:hypothetical protein
MRLVLGFAFFAGVALAAGCSDDDFSADRPPADMAGIPTGDMTTPPDLTGVDLFGIDFTVVDLTVSDLTVTDLSGDLNPGN